MHLLEALDVERADLVDPTRTLTVGPLELGIEAAAEAVRILAEGEYRVAVQIGRPGISRPYYWYIQHQVEGAAEVLGFPKGAEGGLPTAIEVAIVRAIAASPPAQHRTILAGGVEISLGPERAWAAFSKIIAVVKEPLTGTSFLFNEATQAIVNENADTLVDAVAIKCLSNTFCTSPLKFRFLELYRLMEARFIQELKVKLISKFDTEPGPALHEAATGLKSEMKQIIGLAETQQLAFEACWTVLDQLRNTSRFVTALFNRVAEKSAGGGPKWKTGASLIYQIRCSIVHAGERDMIFENYPDSELAIIAVLPHVERAALLLIGVELA